ncbi:MAG TPA: recombination mediator RecR [Candidatus Bathyarchaeia archaeon]|nr:recombination mediator RecR [Candidatus Bathyarchaeia archaeon]
MFPKSFQKLIDHFASLPSVGPKMAERLVLYLFKQDQDKIDDFSEIIRDLKKNIHYCKQCFNISENGLCAICADKKRDQTVICVVEEPLDIIAIEKTRRMRGLYHALGGTINAPADKNNPLKIKELLARLKKEAITEVIIATNPTTEGEATALYLARFIKPLNIKITRLARGLPTGGDIEYADVATLGGAIEGRKEI